VDTPRDPSTIAVLMKQVVNVDRDRPVRGAIVSPDDCAMRRGSSSVNRLWGAAVVLLLAMTACDGSRVPSASLPVPSPTPTPAATRYHVSGVVTDEAGSPIANASIEIDYMPPPGQLGAFVPASANGSGYYEVDFEAHRPFPNIGQPTVGVILAWSKDYQDNDQLLPWGATDIVKNLRLRRVQTVSAGQPITVSIEPDSSICWDREDWFVPDHRCYQFDVVVGSPGTLTIDAHAPEGGAIVPLVFSATSGRYRGQKPGPGTVSLFQVEAGQRYHIFVGIPDGTAPQRYSVSTSLQAPEAAGSRD
jgi:hypothetical protein